MTISATVLAEIVLFLVALESHATTSEIVVEASGYDESAVLLD